MKQGITQDELKRLVNYDPETGDFTWVAHYRGVTRGKPVGIKRTGEYHRIRLNKSGYRAHRLAWLYMTGEWPAGEIDHVNGEPSDNRWCNLRVASRDQNAANVGLRVTNQSGHTGVKEMPKGGWRAYIRGKHLGVFNSQAEAVAAYQTAALYEYGSFTRRPGDRLNRVNKHNAALHFVVSEEAAKADLLPGARRVK